MLIHPVSLIAFVTLLETCPLNRCKKMRLARLSNSETLSVPIGATDRFGADLIQFVCTKGNFLATIYHQTDRDEPAGAVVIALLPFSKPA